MQLAESAYSQFTNGHGSRVPAKNPDKSRAAMERMELYCMAHPGSPSAMRRPQLLSRGSIWVVLLGSTIEEGITGFGHSVEAALRAFDAQYLRGSRRPEPLEITIRAAGEPKLQLEAA